MYAQELKKLSGQPIISLEIPQNCT